MRINFIRQAIIFFIYGGCALILRLLTDLPDRLVLFLIILLFVIFYDSLHKRLSNKLTRFGNGTVRDAVTLLDQLNTQLNHARHYHDVTRQLFSAFDQLFKDHAYLFYILETDIYYLAHYANVQDGELLQLNIPFQDVHFRNEKGGLKFGTKEYLGHSELLDKLKNLELDTIHIFNGHTQPIAFLICRETDLSIFDDMFARGLFEKIQKKAGLILENTALILDLELKNKEMRKLVEVGQQILSSFDTKQILDFVIKTLKAVIGYDAAAVFLLDKSGKQLLNVSSDGYNIRQNEQLGMKVGEGAVGWAVQTKAIDILDDVRNANHYCPLRPETHSQISIPLIFDDRVLGVLCLESNRLAYFNSGMVDSLKLFSQLASIAIHNARQLDIILANKAYEHELINASTVQKRLLVQNIPVIPPLKVSAVNISSKIISGDLYDVIRYDENALGLAIGDVSGKGAPAALMMTLILAGLRSHKQTFLTVCDLVYRLNNLLHESIIEGKYASFFYGVVSLKENRFYYTNAGHNPPIYIRENGDVKTLTEGGPVLGFLPDRDYRQADVKLYKGDLIIAYTDGISEAMNEQEEEFGEQRLIDLALSNRHKTVHEIKQTILNAVQQFSVDDDPMDDMTLLICKYT